MLLMRLINKNKIYLFVVNRNASYDSYLQVSQNKQENLFCLFLSCNQIGSFGSLLKLKTSIQPMYASFAELHPHHSKDGTIICLK